MCVPGAAHQVPLSMELFRQEYWSGLPFPPPGDLPDPGIKPASPVSPALQADSLLLVTGGAHCIVYIFIISESKIMGGFSLSQ